MQEALSNLLQEKTCRVVTTMFSKTLLLFFVVYFVSGSSNGLRTKKKFRDDYSYIEAVESFYKIHTTPRKWIEAKRVCALEGATLWHPDNEDEARAVKSFWKTTHPSIGWVYVGLSDIMAEGVFKTIDGISASKVYNEWQLGQPDDFGGKEDCVYIYKDGYLDDWPCDYEYEFICKKSLQTLESYYHCNSSGSDGQEAKNVFRKDYRYIASEKSFYKIHTLPQTWADAQQVCGMEDANFWYPENDDEARAVLSFWDTTQPQIGWVYVGMSDIMTEGEFKTIDGKSVSEVYRKWYPGQPNNRSTEDCLYIYKDGQLDDWGCEYKYSFICKKRLQTLEWYYHCDISESDKQKTKKVFRDDYSYIEAVESFYKIHTTKRKWIEAKRECALEGATLWHPDNENEARAVKSLWKTTHPSIGWVYVGLSDIMAEGVFKTIDGIPASKVYNEWELGQPDNFHGKEDCVYIYKDGYLDDWPCDYEYEFICKKSLQTLESYYHCNSSNSDGQEAKNVFRKDYRYIAAEESFYKIHTSPRTWADAQQVCKMEDANFWYPDNDDEARTVISYWNTTQPEIGWVYVGMSDITTEGQFKTINGKAVSEVYRKWYPGQPNNYRGAEDCVYMYKDGQLDDWGCESKYSFICKKSLQSLEWYYHCDISESVVQKPERFFRNDYSYIEAEKSFYKIHTSPRTWAEAKRVCYLEGATFWHPDNDDEASAVISFWNTNQPHIGWVYVGLSDLIAEGLFETVDGKSVSEVYNNWQSEQPNDYGGKQDCVYMYKSGILDDWGCDYKYSFICKKSLQSLKWNNRCNISNSDYIFNEDNGKCYKVHTTPKNWTEAYAVCRREQSHLAVISNQQETDYLVNLTESTPNPRVKENYEKGMYHVGFHNILKEGWQTVKGTPMNMDAAAWWDSYKPADDRDQCGSMFYTGRLINTDCNMKSFFICEHEVDGTTVEPMISSDNEENFQ